MDKFEDFCRQDVVLFESPFSRHVGESRMKNKTTVKMKPKGQISLERYIQCAYSGTENRSCHFNPRPAFRTFSRWYKKKDTDSPMVVESFRSTKVDSFELFPVIRS